MALELGRLGRLYAGLHTAHGDTPTPASTDALRHIMFLASHNPKSRRNSSEKQATPFQFARFDGREDASLRQLTCLMRPSGVLNTVPEASEIFEAAFGSKTNVTLSTTTNGSEAVGGATLTSAGSLAVNDFVLITCQDGVKRLRRITSVATNDVTWAPNLAQAPASGAAVKGVLTYKLTAANALVLWFCHYLLKTDASTAGFKRFLSSVNADRFSLSIDATDEAQFTLSGMGKTMITGGSVPSKPAAFTTVGSNPPPGWQTELLIGSTQQKFLKAQIDLSNMLRQRNNEAGAGSANAATESYRYGRPDISIGLDARVEDESVIYDNAESGTNVGVFIQQGFTEGNIWSIALPQVEFTVPDTGDEDEEVNWPFKGMGLNSADGVQDALFLAFG
jgi:hypothetical protein